MEKCRTCNTDILWVKLVSGKRIPILPHTTPAPRPRLVAVNPKTKTGKVLTDKDLAEAWEWADAGATFHQSHLLCWIGKKQKRRKPEVDPDAELERVLMKFPEMDH